MEQEYILNAYEEDVEMRDAEAEEADVEKELDGTPEHQFFNLT